MDVRSARLYGQFSLDKTLTLQAGSTVLSILINNVCRLSLGWTYIKFSLYPRPIPTLKFICLEPGTTPLHPSGTKDCFRLSSFHQVAHLTSLLIVVIWACRVSTSRVSTCCVTWTCRLLSKATSRRAASFTSKYTNLFQISFKRFCEEDVRHKTTTHSKLV